MTVIKYFNVAIFTAAVVYVTLGPPTSASAAWSRAPASECVPIDFNSGADLKVGLGQMISDDEQVIVCPLQERDGLQRDDLTTFNVYVNDASSTEQVYLQVCRRPYTGSTYACGAIETTGIGAQPGDVTWGLSDLDMSEWQTVGGTAYLYVGFGGPDNSYRGYYAEV
jgi:hypothetical protein